MNLNVKELSLILGIKPDENIEDYSIIIKNNKTQETKKEMSIMDLFEGLFQIPIDLSEIQ